jgi:hypothetical protein
MCKNENSFERDLVEREYTERGEIQRCLQKTSSFNKFQDPATPRIIVIVFDRSPSVCPIWRVASRMSFRMKLAVRPERGSGRVMNIVPRKLPGSEPRQTWRQDRPMESK